MLTEVILFGFLVTCVCADTADVVLSCTLVEEGVGSPGMGAAFARTPATLVLRDVPVAPDQSLETLTPFAPPPVPDPDLIVFEAQVSSVQIPGADVLLHADCNDQEVMCEISHYAPPGSQEGSGPAYFMVSVNVEVAGFSTALILQTTEVEKDHTTLMQNKLGLPLSQSGCLPTEVIFLLFSHVNSVAAPLRSDVLLNCGFRRHETLTSQDVAVEWRLQHRGKGHRVFHMKTRLDDAEGKEEEMQAKRRGSSMDAAQVAGEGNASVTLSKLQVSDEGTYICTVSLGLFHAQQVIRLDVVQPPHVSLSEEKLVLKDTSPQTLSCHCSKYYPLDVQVEWFSMSPTDKEPVVFPNQGMLSSHRQHGDRTYSLSSHLAVPPTLAPGTTISCRVSHPALDTPLSVSVVVEGPQPDSYWFVLGFLLITGLFFYQLMR